MKALFIFIITISGLLSYSQVQVDGSNWGYVTRAEVQDSNEHIRASIPVITPGGNETDPVWTSEKSGYATLPITVPPESDPVWLLQKSGYATLPLPAESDPVWTAAAPGYATTTALTNGLSGKANTSHSHPISEVTNLQTTLDGKAATSHTQAISTVTDLQTSLDGKQATLVSGTNIKTINSNSLLGSGDIVIAGGSAYTFVGSTAGDVATGANVTPVNLTGLVWTYAINSTYAFRWTGEVLPAATTTGCGFQLDVSSAVTSIYMGFTHQLANTGTLTGGSSRADDASIGVTSGMASASVPTVVWGDGLLVTGANVGTAQLRFRSETTAVTTAKTGLTLIVEKVK